MKWILSFSSLLSTDADDERDESAPDVDQAPEVNQLVDDIEPQPGPSGVQRHAESNTFAANEEDCSPSVPILETDLDC